MLKSFSLQSTHSSLVLLNADNSPWLFFFISKLFFLSQLQKNYFQVVLFVKCQYKINHIIATHRHTRIEEELTAIFVLLISMEISNSSATTVCNMRLKGCIDSTSKSQELCPRALWDCYTVDHWKLPKMHKLKICWKMGLNKCNPLRKDM